MTVPTFVLTCCLVGGFCWELAGCFVFVGYLLLVDRWYGSRFALVWALIFRLRVTCGYYSAPVRCGRLWCCCFWCW